MSEGTYQQTGFGRVFLQVNGADPGNAYAYLGCGRLGGFTEPLGDISPVTCPSPDMYDEFETVDDVRGEAGAPTATLSARLQPRTILLRIKCPMDLQAHFGKCSTPSDYDGWNQIVHFEHARLTQRSSDTLTALEPSDRASILVNGDLSARYIWYLYPLDFAEVAKEEVTDEVVGVAVDKRVLCGDCGETSDGTEKLYAVVRSPLATSPGLPAELLYSEDKGATWEEHVISTLAHNEDPSGVAIVGSYVVVISNDSGSMHYAPLDDLDDWTEVTTGFVVGGEPNAIFARNATSVWIVGDAGYIYYTENILDGVTVVSDGSAAGSNDLYDVHAVSQDVIIACGAGGTVVYSANGGSSWGAVGGVGLPSATFRCCWARREHVWLVGSATGRLYYSRNSGESWAEVTFPGSGSGVVWDISFAHHASAPVGFMAHKPASGRGRILRTVDGGARWYVMPKSGASIPDNDGIRCIDTGADMNFVFGGGLAANGVDGILVTAS